MSQGGSSNVIDGRRISQLVQEEVKLHVEQLKSEHGVEPGLAVLIIGDRTDSQVYVKHKVIACEKCGIKSVKVELGKETTQEEAERVVRELNGDSSIHGILVQLPIPEHLDEKKLLAEISLEKDVDGFHPTNIGLLAMRDRKALAQPCTPSGVMEILRRSFSPPSPPSPSSSFLLLPPPSLQSSSLNSLLFRFVLLLLDRRSVVKCHVCPCTAVALSPPCPFLPALNPPPPPPPPPLFPSSSYIFSFFLLLFLSFIFLFLL